MKQNNLSEPVSQTELVDINMASEILGVSTATIRNWIKTGQILQTPQLNKKSIFIERTSLELLKIDIKAGKTTRLNNRANKRNSTSTFIPLEQLSNKSLLPLLQTYIEIINEKKIPIQTALFIHSLSVLKNAGLVNYKKSVANLKNIEYKNNNIEKVVLDWDNALKNINLSEHIELLDTDEVYGTDSLGILYQSLLDEGKKSQGGSYYTPRVVIENIINDLSNAVNKNTKVLDPCCGTGQFLTAFSKYIVNPLHLWGYDIDPIAVQIARINLLVCYSDTDFYPNLFVANSLKENPDGRFDIIATNPPWGYHLSKDDSQILKNIYKSVVSNEAFSYFLVRGINLLNENGLLCYVLPETITKVKQHRDIREFLLKNSSIKKIVHLGNVFSKVLSPVITLNIQKSSSEENEIEIVQKDDIKAKIAQERFFKNPEFTFDTSVNKKDEEIIAKLYKKPYETLKDNADWALGIVTGNNKKFISSIKTDDNEGVLKGSDINKYTFNQATSFITFNPDEFQQVAPVWKYRTKEKIIYKFISSKLAFAYDDKQTLTLNSANILIPKIPNTTAKATLAFLNSYVFQYLFQKKFNTVKVLRGDLEQLPFPVTEDNTIAKIEECVNKLASSPEMEDEVNRLVFNAFDLTTEEIKYIISTIRK